MDWKELPTNNANLHSGCTISNCDMIQSSTQGIVTKGPNCQSDIRTKVKLKQKNSGLIRYVNTTRRYSKPALEETDL